jgi:DNA ligase (NAD+)
MPPSPYRAVDVTRLDAEQARVELLSLGQEIERHDELYYQQDQPEVSDAHYDELVQRADAIEAKYASRPVTLSLSTAIASQV